MVIMSILSGIIASALASIHFILRKSYNIANMVGVITPNVLIPVIGVVAMGISSILLIKHEKKMQGLLSKKVEIEKKQMDILVTLSGIYSTCHVINLKEKTGQPICTENEIGCYIDRKTSIYQQMEDAMRQTVNETYLDAALEFTDLSTLEERMNGSNMIAEQFLGKIYGWFRAQFIVNSYDQNHNIETVIFTTQVIDKEKRKEEKLVQISMTDELTGLYNRRAYEGRIEQLEEGMPNDMTVILMDLNGLKNVNDNLGHEAGDEFIREAAKCMTAVYGTRGKIYRTGGDEFIALLQLDLDEMEDYVERFAKCVESRNEYVHCKLSVACGAVSHEQYPDLDILELVRMADKYMYYDKSIYYERTGKKRRR